MGTAFLGIGSSADGRGWSPAVNTPLLFAAGLGHACGFSPLTDRLAAAVREGEAQLSGLILTASLVGQVVGIAAFVGVYLSVAARSSAHALAVTTWALFLALALTAAFAFKATGARVTAPESWP
jgi:hypothetical protein